MADREKVVKGLEACRTLVHCKECPYAYDKRADDSSCEAVLHNDVLELLKELEPVEPMATITANGIHHDFCGKCGRLLPIGQAKYCSYCGQAVKWE